jgi:hypothetical protein
MAVPGTDPRGLTALVRTRTFPDLGFDPAPGSGADVEAVLTRLDQAAGSVDGSAHGMRRAARSGSWQGPAAAAFRSGSDALAGGLDEAVAALRTASRTVSAWQSRLAANQREADELEAQARPLRADPEQADALGRVLDRANRLQARHLRQAAAAAAAMRSATASVPGWPAAGTGRHAGLVSVWTGEVAAGVSVPGWPPADVLPGEILPGQGLPGQEGGSAVPVADLPGMPGHRGPDPAPGLGDLPDGPDLGGLVPDGLAPGPGTEDLPDLPAGLATTSPAGWLDTGHAPAVRPSLDHLPAHRPLPDPGPGAQAYHEVSHGRPVHPSTSVRAERPEPHRPSVAGRQVQHTVERRVAGDREGAVRTSGRGGEGHGPVRLGGHAATSAPAGGPRGPGGVGDPPVHHSPAGGSPTQHTGTPPPLPAPPTGQTTGQTVEQQATPVPPAHDTGGARPDPGRVIDAGRPDQVRAPEPGRAVPPAPVPSPDAPRGTPATPGTPDAARGLEPGRTTGADPNTRPAPATQGQQAVKGRADGDDTSAFLIAPLPTEPGEAPVRAAGLRAFLMTRPEARPILVLIKPGGSGEPLLRTGLTPCARPLPGCATALPAPGPTTVY